MSYSMNEAYAVIGISKQAVAQYSKRQKLFDERVGILILEAEELRVAFPGCGVEKMYDILKPDFIGRDRFVELFMSLGFRLRRKRNYRKTTRSTSLYYPNLIKGMEVKEASTIWQSDITYIHINAEGRYYYAVFIIDVYTKKIVGYSLSNHMRASANVRALRMALKSHRAPRIHHSDRGSQYIYKGYIEMLKQHGCDISMAKTAQDNAYAERINRTIKNDYIERWKPITYAQLKSKMKQAVYHYNHVRTHNAINKMTPVQFEREWALLSDKQRPTMTIFNNEILT